MEYEKLNNLLRSFVCDKQYTDNSILNYIQKQPNHPVFKGTIGSLELLRHIESPSVGDVWSIPRTILNNENEPTTLCDSYIWNGNNWVLLSIERLGATYIRQMIKEEDNNG